jgi:acetyl esterase/lipase
MPRRTCSTPLPALIIALTSTASADAQVVSVRDIDYRPDEVTADGRDLLDVHHSSGAGKAPVVVFLHGGALRAGDKDRAEPFAARIVPLGFVVVAPNYRLSPQVQHPAHVQDAAVATAWAFRHAHSYGGDPERVYLAGHSAGAYLAALLVLDPTHLAVHGLRPGCLRGTIAISPFLYVEETAADRPKDVWGEDPDAWRAASVSPHIRPGQGRMLLIYADGDEPWRKRQNELFVQQMHDAQNADIRAVEVPDRDHSSLVTKMADPDDQIGDLIRQFAQP